MATTSSSSFLTSSSAPPPPPPPAAAKKKRNLPGNPNPDAEVIALSPRALLATNRFLCEVCGKGFQREQNLQLHRRGHNLPWKLKQKNPKDAARRRVYLCPEPSCVHHDPSRALGDLTGIKKHYSRKHGEKKWKCEKCSKKYAVQSDWKAHSKTCGTREYRCDCGTLFSRRDSFITHRAFCDALAQEGARIPAGMSNITAHLYSTSNINLGLPQLSSSIPSLQDQIQRPPSADLLRLRGSSVVVDHLISPANNPPAFRPPQPSSFYLTGGSTHDFNEDIPHQSHHFHGLTQLPDHLQPGNANNNNLGFFSNSNNSSSNQNATSHLLIQDQFNSASDHGSHTETTTNFAGNLLSTDPMGMGMGMGMGMSSLYNSSISVLRSETEGVQQMSATALLQKAAQMGATTSGGGGNPLMMRGFGRTYSGGESSGSQVGDGSRFQNLINSFANGSSSSTNTMFYNTSGQEHETGLHHSLTRDFLGVGSMVRGMQQQHRGLGIGSLDSDMNSRSCSRSFGSGNLQ